MNYKSLINQALSSVTLSSAKVPVFPLNYNGTAQTYITFFCYNEQGELYAENEEISTGFYIQIDIWSKNAADYDNVYSQVKTALISNNFNGITAQDLYEKDTKIYHKAVRCNLIDEGEM